MKQQPPPTNDPGQTDKAETADQPDLTDKSEKAERGDQERSAEQREGLSAERRGSPAAPSDKPEGDTPHPQDVNEIAR